MAKILHITESYGGGVKYAILNYVKNSPSNSHYLLATNGRGQKNLLFTDDEEAKFENVEKLAFSPSFLPTLPLQFLKLETQLNRIAREVCPDFIHLHSSFAGIIGRMYSRVFRKYNQNVKIIYSPHCFAFERKDISNTMRKFYKSLEKFFAKSTDIFAVCSKREENLAKELTDNMTDNKRVIFVPNVSNLILPDANNSNNEDGYKVITIGRVCPQKNYQFLDGLNSDVKILSSLTQEQLAKEVANAKIYIICSLWEGFPIAILDAIKARLPIVALNCEYLEDEAPKEYIFDNHNKADELIEKLLSDEDLRKECAKKWQDTYSYCCNEQQEKSLKLIYRDR